MQPPTHEEIETVTPVLASLFTLIKWIGGPAVAAWIVGRFLFKGGIAAGEVKSQYTELSEDVEAIKEREKSYITIPQHEILQKVCTQNLIGIIDNRTHATMAELRSEMSTLNGNICKIMGALDIQPDDRQPRHRCSTDQ